MLINGVKADAVSALDRGLLYGDGLFETLRVVEGEPCNWSRHIARLSKGCQRLGLEMPESQLLLSEVLTLCQDQKQAVAKIIVTRGVGGRGYMPASIAATSTRIIQCFPWPNFSAENSQQGVAVRICTLRLSEQPLLAGLKHLNRLENVLARGEWQDPSIAEGLLRNGLGDFVEGTMSNLFVVDKGVMSTDPLKKCGVAGIMREIVIEQAENLGIQCMQQTIDETRLKAADELFMCNSLIGIWPVREIVGLSEYCVGPITRQLQNAIKVN